MSLGRLEGASRNLDSKDWEILSLVQTSARMSFAELGRKVGLSAPAVAERLRRLEDARLILGYHAQVATSKLGLTLTAFIELTIKRSNYDRFLRSVEKINWILECHHTAGRASFLLKAAVPDSHSLEVLIGQLSEFGDTTSTLVLSSPITDRKFLYQPSESSAAQQPYKPKTKP